MSASKFKSWLQGIGISGIGSAVAVGELVSDIFVSISKYCTQMLIINTVFSIIGLFKVLKKVNTHMKKTYTKDTIVSFVNADNNKNKGISVSRITFNKFKALA